MRTPAGLSTGTIRALCNDCLTFLCKVLYRIRRRNPALVGSQSRSMGIRLDLEGEALGRRKKNHRSKGSKEQKSSQVKSGPLVLTLLAKIC